MDEMLAVWSDWGSDRLQLEWDLGWVQVSDQE